MNRKFRLAGLIFLFVATQARGSDTKFNHDRGFFQAPFDLEITTKTPGLEIRYTLDGSEPSPTSGKVYQGPLPIKGTTTVRAASFKDGQPASNVDTQTYLFLGDILIQKETPPPGWPANGQIHGHDMNYGMDPDVVNDATWGPLMRRALTDIPSLSVVTALSNLFDPNTGIYIHAHNSGKDWERKASLELIYPSGVKGFQIDGGLRIRGNHSTSRHNPKHAFRFVFRKEYGKGKLKYPLFGKEGAHKFDKIDLRTSQNYSWSFGGDDRNLMLRDVFSRDLQREMGHPYTRSRFYHLYLNGQYWGLYQTQERVDNYFGETYLGGDRDDYDVLKTKPGKLEVKDGDVSAWRLLYDSLEAGVSDEVYYGLQGMKPDQTPDPRLPVLLDVDNLIDYMLIIFYTGNIDAPVSAFMSNNGINNWYAVRNRQGRRGFAFFAHDSEHSMVELDWNRVGPFSAGSQFDTSNPQWLHQRLMEHPEYRVRFADRAIKHLYGGVLSPERAKALMLTRAKEIETAIVAESARWGDSKLASTQAPYTRKHWKRALEFALEGFIALRRDVLLNQLKAAKLISGTVQPLLPDLEPGALLLGGVMVDRPEVAVKATHLLGLAALRGEIHYSLNGEDPRQVGGAVHPASLKQGGPSAKGIHLVEKTSAWRYLDKGVAPSNWTQPQFDDSSWAAGVGEFGYGDGDEGTVIHSGSSGVDRPMTAYFRTRFQLSNAGYRTRLKFICDDGMVVYLNGREVYRYNIGNGPVHHLTPAQKTIQGAMESTWIEVELPATQLHSGENTLAVEVHQVHDASSDVSFHGVLSMEQFIGSTFQVLKDTDLLFRVRDKGQWSPVRRVQLSAAREAVR